MPRGRSPLPTPAAWSTATSSPTTCCSPEARQWSPTSAWPRRSPPATSGRSRPRPRVARRSPRLAPRSAPSGTWPRSRPPPIRPRITAPTSTPSAPWLTRCSPAAPPSRGSLHASCSPPSWPVNRSRWRRWCPGCRRRSPRWCIAAWPRIRPSAPPRPTRSSPTWILPSRAAAPSRSSRPRRAGACRHWWASPGSAWPSPGGCSSAGTRRPAVSRPIRSPCSRSP